jgi:integrase/recombinase XerC
MPSLKSYIDEFLLYIEQIRGYTPDTITTYKTALMQMSEVSEFYKEENRWILDLTPFRLKIARINKKSIRTKVSAIHSFANYLREQRRVKLHLIADELIKVPQTLPKPINEIYINEVLEYTNTKERLLLLMLYGLGLRIGELSKVKVEDIGESWIVIHGKGNIDRQMPLLPLLKSSIDSYITEYAPKIYLFEKKERGLNTAQLRYILQKLFKSKGLKATPHQLRHSFATHLLEKGARISDISELLGHHSMASTQLYTKLGSEKKRAEYLNAHPLAKG